MKIYSVAWTILHTCGECGVKEHIADYSKLFQYPTDAEKYREAIAEAHKLLALRGTLTTEIREMEVK